MVKSRSDGYHIYKPVVNSTVRVCKMKLHAVARLKDSTAGGKLHMSCEEECLKEYKRALGYVFRKGVQLLL